MISFRKKLGDQREYPHSSEAELSHAAEAQNILLRIGGKRLGTPSVFITATIRAASDIERLESAIERVSEVESWDELLPL